MSDKQLLQRAWDALAIWKETYPEGWDADDERLLDDLLTRIAEPQREWQGLTDEEMEEAMKYWSDPCRSAYGGAEAADDEYVDMIGTWRYIEAKLKEKNHG